MTEEISYYDDELRELCSELRQKIDGLPRLSGDARAEVRAGERPRAPAAHHAHARARPPCPLQPAPPAQFHARALRPRWPRLASPAREQRIAQLGVRIQRAKQVLHSFKVEMRELSKEDAYLYDQVRGRLSRSTPRARAGLPPLLTCRALRLRAGHASCPPARLPARLVLPRRSARRTWPRCSS